MPLYTRDAILDMLNKSDRAVERAVIALNNRQTSDERASETTLHHNGRGWNGFDARYGTYLAQYLTGGQGRKLTGNHLVKARKMVRKYVGQLVEVANG